MERPSMSMCVNLLDYRAKLAEWQEQRIDALEKLVSMLSNPKCDGDTAYAVNEVGWFLIEYLGERGVITECENNYLKPMFCESLKFYISRLELGD